MQTSFTIYSRQENPPGSMYTTDGEKFALDDALSYVCGNAEEIKFGSLYLTHTIDRKRFVGRELLEVFSRTFYFKLVLVQLAFKPKRNYNRWSLQHYQTF